LIKSFVSLSTKEWELLIVGPYSAATGGGGEKYLQELKDLSKNSNVNFLEPIFILKNNEIYCSFNIFIHRFDKVKPFECHH
jgi:hypothetical protein